VKITRIGLDIAKQVFQVHGVDERGKVGIRKVLAPAKVLQFFVQLPPCLVGIEACASSHYWGRELTKLGHTVRLMAAQFVIPYRKRSKNDANDAEAICEAVGRPSMRFVERAATVGADGSSGANSCDGEPHGACEPDPWIAR
jgi:transposase